MRSPRPSFPLPVAHTSSPVNWWYDYLFSAFEQRGFVNNIPRRYPSVSITLHGRNLGGPSNQGSPDPGEPQTEELELARTYTEALERARKPKTWNGTKLPWRPGTTEAHGNRPQHPVVNRACEADRPPPRLRRSRRTPARCLRPEIKLEINNRLRGR